MTVRRVKNLEELKEDLISVPRVVDSFNKVTIMAVMSIMTIMAMI